MDKVEIELEIENKGDDDIDDIQSVTDKNGVTDEKQYKHLKLHNCYDVTDEKGGGSEGYNQN